MVHTDKVKDPQILRGGRHYISHCHFYCKCTGTICIL